MATLPISVSRIMTPYRLNEDETASFTESASGSTKVVRHGGHRLSLSLAIEPINILNEPEFYAELDMFLVTYPFFAVPIQNSVETTLSTTVTVTAAAAVGSLTISVRLGAANKGSPVPGQFIRVGPTKTKVYRVASYTPSTTTAGVITLTKPLRHAATPNQVVVWDGKDGTDSSFSGVLGVFVNPDFGHPLHRIESGVLAKFGPLELVEYL